MAGTPKPDKKNIRAAETKEVIWDNADLVQSLRSVRMAAEDEGQKAIDWYWRHTRLKRYLSRLIQFSALTLAALAGLLPVVNEALKGTRYALTDSGMVATLCVGIAAALVGLDKAFGFSSGWTRYVLTATSMTKLLHEFRLDWISQVAASDDHPTAQQQMALIQRAKDFISTIQGMVLQETKDWATEFQSNMAQMEKDLKSQLDTLKAQVEKTAKEKEDASKPGSIALTVTNADKTDGFRFDVTLEGPSGKFSDSVSSATIWTRINVAPGQHKASIDAKAKGSAVATSIILDVSPGETKKDSVSLPIS